MPDVWPSAGIGEVRGFVPSRRYFSKRDGVEKESYELAQLEVRQADGSIRTVEFPVRDFDRCSPPLDVKGLPPGSLVRYSADIVLPSFDAAPGSRAYVRLLSAEVVTGTNGAGAELAAADPVQF